MSDLRTTVTTGNLAVPFTTRSGRTIEIGGLGCGGALFGNPDSDKTPDEVEALIDAAWQAGVRYFDTAPYYGLGLSERYFGAALARYPRWDFVLSTKVGKRVVPAADDLPAGDLVRRNPARRIEYDYGYDGVMRSFAESLDRLGLDRVDVLFVHDVDAFTHGSREASEQRIAELIGGGGWKALEGLRSSGAVAAIGIGVNEWQPCARLLELADPDLFLLAGRYTLLEQDPAATLFPQCRKAGIGIVVGGPYNSGILVRPDGQFNYSDAPRAVVSRVEALRAICGRFGVELAHAALQFLRCSPDVMTVLPGPHTPAEVEANIAYWRRPVPAQLWSMLRKVGLIRSDVKLVEEGGHAEGA